MYIDISFEATNAFFKEAMRFAGYLRVFIYLLNVFQSSFNDVSRHGDNPQTAYSFFEIGRLGF